VGKTFLELSEAFNAVIQNTSWAMGETKFFDMNSHKVRSDELKLQKKAAIGPWPKQRHHVNVASNLWLSVTIKCPAYAHNAHKLVRFELDWNELKREIQFPPFALVYFQTNNRLARHERSRLSRLAIENKKSLDCCRNIRDKAAGWHWRDSSTLKSEINREAEFTLAVSKRRAIVRISWDSSAICSPTTKAHMENKWNYSSQQHWITRWLKMNNAPWTCHKFQNKSHFNFDFAFADSSTIDLN
jgi:hypothetical protein